MSDAKAIITDCIITGIRARSDGSLGLTVSTPELSSENKVVFLNLHNKNCKMLLTPEDATEEPPEEVKAELEHKTLSQRIRGAYFVWWKQQNQPGTFESFYSAHQTKVLDHIKSKLDDDLP